jgi:hypothetical protein
MDVDEMVAHGWKFHLSNGQLTITSEQDANAHVELSSEAAFSLLDYLYQYRNALSSSRESNEKEPAVLEEDATMGATAQEMASDDEDISIVGRRDEMARARDTTSSVDTPHPFTH